MNNQNINREELIHRATPKLLALIINPNQVETAVETLKHDHFHFLLSCRAKGTANTSWMELIGLGSIDKTVLLSLAPDTVMKAALFDLQRNLHLEKPGHGIAMTIPISGIDIARKIPLDPQRKEVIQHKIEQGVEETMNTIENDLILTIINQGYASELMEHARSAGAGGGTIINSKQLSTENAVKFLGVEISADKEILAIVTSRESKSKLMEAISNYLQQETNAHGAMLSLPIDTIVGLGNH